MDRKVFQAYVVTDRQSGKRYVGITSRSLRQRWNEHVSNARHRATVSLLDSAIGKRGADVFAIEVVCEARSWADVCAVEAVLIRQLDTRHPHGYNMSDGGEGPHGVKRTPESVERSAAKHRGRPCHPNTREVSSRFHLGRKKSTEHRARIAAAKAGIPRSEATKAKLRAYWAERRACGEFTTSQPYEHARKAASAHIAKIPLPLARWIARCYYV